MGKGRLAYFSPKCNAIVPLSKEYFPFSYVALFGYDKSANEGTVKYWQNFGQFPHLPENSGTRQQIQSRHIKTTLYPQLTVTYAQAIHSLFMTFKS